MDDRSRETAVDVVRRCREAGIELDPVLAAYHCAALRYQGVPWDDAFTQTAAERIVAALQRGAPIAVDAPEKRTDGVVVYAVESCVEINQ